MAGEVQPEAPTPARAATEAKEQQILDGARRVFMAHGFSGVGVDTIARTAGVSKATLYSYFPDKATLFQAVLHAECNAIAARAFKPELASLSIEQALREVATHFVALFLSPEMVRLFRVVLGDIERFPQLGQALYDAGPALTHRHLRRLLGDAAARGELRIEDLDEAAGQFRALCRAQHFERSLFGIAQPASKDQIDHAAAATVRVFLAAYGTD
ncbi:MAG: TetR/AcrR family transcriptional regulator [Myxococcota bacterium]